VDRRRRPKRSRQNTRWSERVTGAAAAFAVLVSGLGVAVTFLLDRQNIAITNDSQITDIFSRATEDLGSSSVPVRIGAISTLERLMRTSPTDQETISNVLATYIRVGAAGASKRIDRVPGPDIQTALTVLTGHPMYAHVALKLQGLNLNHVDLHSADLQDADLTGANLRGADLNGADLRGARLAEADLSGADLRGATVGAATMIWANLSEARLDGLDLRSTLLGGANLTLASLVQSDVRGVDLRAVRGTHIALYCSLVDHDTLLPPGIMELRYETQLLACP
jgi:Pentapeptide repeats (8 copies)